MAIITLSNGFGFYADDDDIQTLVDNGMLEVLERDEDGNITKAKVTEAGKQYIENVEKEEKGKWN